MSCQYFRNIFYKPRPQYKELKMVVTETLSLLIWVRSFIKFYGHGKLKLAPQFEDKLAESTPGAPKRVRGSRL